MSNTFMRLIVAAGIAALVLASAPAFATAQRTFVASTGNDANACSIIAPCRTFATAIAQTNSDGEVIVLDSAGYGPVTISKSVSIIAPAGIYAGISATSVNGITINGSGIAVALRGLTLNGTSSGVGVEFTQGQKLIIEECHITGFDTGIVASAGGSKVTVRNAVVRNNSVGFRASGDLDAMIDSVYFNDSYNFGVNARLGARVTVANSTFFSNFVTSVETSALSSVLTDVMVTHSTISGSLYGLRVSASTGGVARLVSDGNAINNSPSTAFLFMQDGGTEIIYTAGNNTVGFNNGIVAGGVLTPIGTH
jgi:hypothetical protein